jgi:hypothetical protein
LLEAAAVQDVLLILAAGVVVLVVCVLLQDYP